MGTKKSLNIDGQVFGNLTVIISNKEFRKSIPFSLCQCKCNTIKLINKYDILNGKITSCGCREGFQKQYNLEKGSVFGKLTIIEYLPGKAAYKCKCICGSEIEANSVRLRTGRIVNCGSIRCTLKRDIVGERFGKLIAQNDFYYKKMGRCNRSYVKVLCDCGTEKYVLTTALLGGDTTSCGCYKKQRINETYAEYRISKGYRGDELMTPFTLARRSELKSSGIYSKILKRDNFKCKLCGITNTASNLLQVHHIIPVATDASLIMTETNLITLCTNCHINKAHLGSTKKLNEDLVPILQNLINL